MFLQKKRRCLAIEDCLHLQQRPKLDHYENHHFFVLHAIDQQILQPKEIGLFLGDMRDSYLSINSNRMNMIMKTLTVMTSIFIPLTFIASIYGMKFRAYAGAGAALGILRCADGDGDRRRCHAGLAVAEGVVQIASMYEPKSKLWPSMMSNLFFLYKKNVHPSFRRFNDN